MLVGADLLTRAHCGYRTAQRLRNCSAATELLSGYGTAQRLPKVTPATEYSVAGVTFGSRCGADLGGQSQGPSFGASRNGLQSAAASAARVLLHSVMLSFVSASATLWPPKPNELFSAANGPSGSGCDTFPAIWIPRSGSS